MSEQPERTTRRRGRPAAGDTVDRRAAVVDAARRLFAEQGFGAVSMRAVARAAGVDPRLVHHYFADKTQLLVATLDLPFNPMERIATAAGGPRHELGFRIVRTFVESWDPHRGVFATIARSQMGGDELPSHLPGTGLIDAVVVERLAMLLDGDRLRAALLASVVFGLGLARYVVEVDPVAAADIDDVVAIYGPAAQAIIDGHHPPA